MNPRPRRGARRTLRTVVLAALAVLAAVVVFAAIRIQTHPVANSSAPLPSAPPS